MHYTSEKHTQILIALLKYHGIKKVVASPGATNICFINSIQHDPWFTLYSSVDERSAAYIAVGLAAESGEPIALSCTGATASRNYVPGLTEAYYRNLPIVAITASQHLGRVGNLHSQVIDRSEQLNDIAKDSTVVDCVYTAEDEWSLQNRINRVLISMRNNGGGPVHLNLVTTYSRDYSVRELPPVTGIAYYENIKKMPSLKAYHRIAILAGVHRQWEPELTEEVDKFCEMYNAVVLQYHACNYKGKYGVNFSLIQSMVNYDPIPQADLVIHIGTVPRYHAGMKQAENWRISMDGKISDSEGKLTKVFKCEEYDFFKYYVDQSKAPEKNTSYAKKWQDTYREVIQLVTDLPFSNVWVAQNTINKIPENSVLHMAGSNTSRAWNFFELPKTVTCYSNDGTMGIDGQLSALIGESFVSPGKLHFGVMGDLTFFYDMNSLGNRHIKNNIRLLVINNGKGAEFKLYIHPGAAFGENTEPYIAAAGHYGNKSPNLIRHYAEDLGFEYLTASNKEEYLAKLDIFLDPTSKEKSMVFEVFTDSKNESDAIYIMNHLTQDTNGLVKETAKVAIKKIAGEKGVQTIKKIIGRN